MTLTRPSPLLFRTLLAIVVIVTIMTNTLSTTLSTTSTTTTVSFLFPSTHAFTLVMMGGRKRNLRQSLDDVPSNKNKKTKSSFPRGKGQEITGVTLPAEGTIKGWEFGNNQRVACANLGNNRFAGIQGECPRCGFDLFQGDLIVDSNNRIFPGNDQQVPCVACPTCSTTFHLETGKHGPTVKRNGLSAFVNGLAQTATMSDANKNAKVYVITRDVDENDDEEGGSSSGGGGGRVYMRER